MGGEVVATGGPDLSLVRRLKAKGRYDEALQQLNAWLDGDPDNPLLLYEVAATLDNQGRAADAIPFYQQALAGELDPLHRVDAIVGLGSSLRVTGRIRESYGQLSEGLREYPRHQALKVFYALTLERMGNFGDAVTELLDVIADSGQEESLELYRPAIRHYRDFRHDGALGLVTEEPEPP